MRTLTTLLFGLSAVVAMGQTTPAVGSPDRVAMMNALRVPVQKALKTKVQFKVEWLKMEGGWAFMRGTPQQPNGSKIDYKKTPYKRQYEDGAFSDFVCALFRKKGGKWTIVQYALGPTDVAYEPWPKQFGAPKSIFGLPN